MSLSTFLEALPFFGAQFPDLPIMDLLNPDITGSAPCLLREFQGREKVLCYNLAIFSVERKKYGRLEECGEGSHSI